ncbi:MAG: HEAT repeat domain-containing protein, partial [Planctomycetota bacterium]
RRRDDVGDFMANFQFPEVSSRRDIAEVLLGFLKDPDLQMRWRAAELLRCFVDSRDAQRLEHTLVDPDEHRAVRDHVCTAFDLRDLPLRITSFQRLVAEVESSTDPSCYFPSRDSLHTLYPHTAEGRSAANNPFRVPCKPDEHSAWYHMHCMTCREYLFVENCDVTSLGRFHTYTSMGRFAWSHADFERLKLEYPRFFHRALQEFALPADLTIQLLGERDVWDRVPLWLARPERDVQNSVGGVEALARVPGGVAEIDRLLQSSWLEGGARRACQEVRVHYEPTPDIRRFQGTVIRRNWRHIVDHLLTPALVEWLVSEETAENLYHLDALLSRRPEALDDATLERLTTGPRRDVRTAAWGELARRGDADARRRLIQTAADGDHVTVRAWALRSLSRIPDAPVELFVSAIRHDTASDRRGFFQPAVEAATAALGWGSRASESVALREICGASFRRTMDCHLDFVAAIHSWIERRSTEGRPPPPVPK